MLSGSTTIVAFKPCGCVRGLYIKNGIPKRDAAKVVAAWIADGCTVRPIPTDEARALTYRCEAHPKPPKQEGLPL